ncbi:ROK family transcriptional regulator [Flindersiella endophytica]
MQSSVHSATTLRRQGALAVLRHVHANPGSTRSEAARALGISSGSATEITGRLKDLRLVAEGNPEPTGARGRPSPVLVAHPGGPLVCAVEISHERWRVAAVELGGALVEDRAGRHASRKAADVLAELRREVRACWRRYGARLQAVSVAVAGTVRGAGLVQATNLRWRDVSLETLRPQAETTLLVGNDATLAGLAEARRGVGADARVVLHLTVEVGLGGVLVVDGVPIDGATGAGGEFGHMPFGDSSLRCQCGAFGCWDLTVDGRAMARSLGEPPPRDPRTKAERVLLAAATDPAARSAAGTAAHWLGRGIAGLVNALDPDLVSLSGLAIGLSETAPEQLRASYRAGLMRFRRTDPPPLVTSRLGAAGPLTGAADAAFDTILSSEGLAAWGAGTDAK